MSVFVKKHYGSQRAGLFNFFIQTAIWFRAAVSSVGHFIKWIGLPVIDALIILFSFLSVKIFWGNYVRPEVIYEERLLIAVIPLFTVIYLFIAYYTGLYNKYFAQRNLNRSAITAIMTVLALYSLLPESLRFSRGIILFGSIMAYLLLSLFRKLLVKSGIIETTESAFNTKIFLVSGVDEWTSAGKLLSETGKDQQIFGRVSNNKNENSTIGSLDELPQLVQEIAVKEIIFCEGDVSYKSIIEQIQLLPHWLRYKFYSKNSHSIVGSDSKDEAGDYLAMEKFFVLAQPVSKRNKRLWDVLYALFFLISFPLHFIFQKKPVQFFVNVFAVLLGKKTWVGYCFAKNELPLLLPSVLSCTGLPQQLNHLPKESLEKADYWYARDYSVGNDINIVWKNYKHLGA